MEEEERFLQDQYRRETDEEMVARRNTEVMGGFDQILGAL